MKPSCNILLTFGINGSLRRREVSNPQPYTEYYLFNSAANLKAYSYDGLDFAYYGYNAANTRTYKLSILNMNQWVNGQPFPLHFSFGEVFLRSAKSKQACIPLSLSENVLCWLKESLRQASKKELVHFFEREQTSPKVTEAKERAFRGGGKNPVHHARQLAERRNPLRSRRSAPLSCYGRRIFSVTPQVGEMTYSNREIQRIQLWQDATVSSEVPPCNLLFSFLCFVSFIFSGRRKKERNEGKNFYYHTNHLGSTAFVTDQNQNITQGFLYAPFGEITTEFNATFGSDIIPKYSFNAKELDEETGMYYYEARYYKPPVLTSRDAMMDQKPWLTPYHYCSNNPIGRVDPSGMLDDDYFNEKGQYLGSDNANTDYVRIIKQKDWDSHKTTDENGTETIDHSVGYEYSKLFSYASSRMTEHSQLNVYQHYNFTGLTIGPWQENIEFGSMGFWVYPDWTIVTENGIEYEGLHYGIAINLIRNRSGAKPCDHAYEIINMYSHENQHYVDFIKYGFEMYANKLFDSAFEASAVTAQMQHYSWGKTRQSYRTDILKYRLINCGY